MGMAAAYSFYVTVVISLWEVGIWEVLKGGGVVKGLEKSHQGQEMACIKVSSLM